MAAQNATPKPPEKSVVDDGYHVISDGVKARVSSESEKLERAQSNNDAPDTI